MKKNISTIITALGLSAATLANSQIHAQDETTKKASALEDAIQEKTRELTKKEGKVQIEELAQDWSGYEAGIKEEQAKILAQKYKETSDGHWFGFVKIENDAYVGLFKRKTQAGNFVKWVEPVSKEEEKFIRTLYDSSQLKLKKLDIPAEVLKKIDDDYAGFAGTLIARATGEKEFGKNVTKEVAQMSKNAIEHAGANRIAFLKAMSKMNDLELVLALNTLPLIDNPDYGFAYQKGSGSMVVPDLQVMSAEAFYDDMKMSAQALNEFPWAKKEAQEHWDNVVQGAVNPRFSNESHVPGARRILFSAAKELLKDAKTPEEALERFIVAVRKVFRYSSGYGWADGSTIDALRSHYDRCEKQADLGSMLCRAAGIPSYEAEVPWWPQMNGNHAWQIVVINGRMYSFLMGEHTLGIVDGKPNLHVYDLSRKDLKPIEVDGKVLKAMVAGKVYKMVHVPAKTRLEDITDKATETTTCEIELGSEFSAKRVNLSVYNSTMYRQIASQNANGSGVVKFEKVGCRPWPAVKVEGKEVYDGLLYEITDEKGQLLTDPFTLLPSGKVRPVKPYEEGTDLVEVRGLPEKKTYEVRVFYHAAEKKRDNLMLKEKYNSDEKGILRLPGIKEDNLVFLNEDGKGLDDLRPWVIRKESDGKLYAHKR